MHSFVLAGAGTSFFFVKRFIREGDIDMGKAIACFSLGKTEVSKSFIESKSSSQDIIEAPSIDDESFSIKRGYKFKPSTIRKIYELKTLHPNVDIYLNIILDDAIQHFCN